MRYSKLESYLLRAAFVLAAFFLIPLMTHAAYQQMVSWPVGILFALGCLIGSATFVYVDTKIDSPRRHRFWLTLGLYLTVMAIRIATWLAWGQPILWGHLAAMLAGPTLILIVVTIQAWGA